MHIEQVAQGVIKFPLLIKMGSAVQDHVGRPKDKQAGGLRRSNVFHEQFPVDFETGCRRSDRVVQIDHCSAADVPERRNFVHPLTVIALVIRITFSADPAGGKKRPLHFWQLARIDHDVDVRE